MKGLFRNVMLVLVFASPVYAADKTDVSALCRQLDDLRNSAEYVPNVDVHGKHVAPADVSRSSSQYINNPIIIPIEIDLIDRFGLSLPTEISLKPTIASLKIYQDGRVKYNDEDVTERTLSLCKDKQEITHIPQSEHGQRAHNPLPSSDKIEGQYPDDRKSRAPHYNE
ncbi:MAG: hypothetical protein COB14_07180 [Alphaproteobacteria bacterium]|nr:MAG: hypothetical protein COB14_07180 [Alphaproteobacteria bacterium]